MKRNLRFEAFYRHSPDRVWRALTDSKAIAKWLMENDFIPEVGHRFQLRAKPQPGWSGIVNCEVLEVKEPERLTYSWKTESIDTMVTFMLTPVEGGTRLTLEHTGFTGARGLMISLILGSGWKGILKKALPDVIASDIGRTSTS